MTGTTWYVNASASPGGNGESPATAFQTIQDGVDAANPSGGDTVDVAAGTYDELVVIDRPLTLDGAEAGVDARTRTAVPESLVGTPLGAFQIEADQVTIDGFTIQGVTADPNSDPAGLGAGIWSNPGYSGTHGGFTIVNNIIQNSVAGIELDSDGTYLTTVQDNLIQNNTSPGAGSGNGIEVSFGLSNALIDSNTFTGQPNAAIVTEAPSGTNGAITISNNQITSGNGGVDLYDTQNTTIEDNTITDSSGDGIAVAGGDSNISIESDTIQSTVSGASGVSVSDSYDAGANSGVVISNNVLAGTASTYGVRIESAYTAYSDANPLLVKFNDLSGNGVGIQSDNAAAMSIDASANYWGSSDPSTVQSMIAGANAAAVDFTPLLDDAGTNDAPGYTPDLSAVTVHSLGIQIGGTGRIQEGINLVTAGGTVNVAAGTYGEQVLIDKSLSLLGANAGIHPAVGENSTAIVGTRGPESILSHSGLYALEPDAADITIDGFEFTGSGNRVIDSMNSAPDFTFTNNIISDPDANGTSSGIMQFEASGGNYDGMTLQFNLLTDQASNPNANMILLGGDASYANLLIDSNTIDSSTQTMLFDTSNVPLTGAVISQNEFSGKINGTSGVGSNALNIGQAGNIQITGNYFHDMNYTNFQLGIVDGSITGNTFAKTSAFPGGPYGGYAFQLWGGEYGTSISSDVTITNNVIHYNDVAGATYPTRGIGLGPSGSANPGIEGSTIHINDNTFINGGVLANTPAIVDQGDPASPVDASVNWWSTTNDSAIAGLMSGPVDFTPYFNSGTNLGSGEGFTGDYSTLDVTALGSQTGSTGRIQEGINDVTSDGTVNVEAGTYSGAVDATGTTVTLAIGGPSTTGIVVNDGDFTLGSTDTLAFKVNGGTPGTSFDQWNVDGVVTLDGATLSTSGTGSAQVLPLILNPTTESVVGTFANLPEASTVVVNGVTYAIRYDYNADGTANDVVLYQGADLSISDSGPSTAIAGDPAGFNYTVVVTNTGPSNNVGGFTVTDVLPAGLTFQSAGSTSGAVVNGQTVTFTNTSGLTSGNTETFVIHVKLSPSAPNSSVLLDTASVATNGTIDPNSDNNTSNTVSTTVQTKADLVVTVSAPSSLAGCDLTYTVTIANNGPSDAQSVVLSDTTPASAAFLSASSVAGWTPSGVPSFGTSGPSTMTFSTTTLAAGASASFAIKVQVAGTTSVGTQVTDTASATSTTTDPNSSNNTDILGSSTVGNTGVGLSTNLANPSQVNLVAEGNTIAFALVSGQTGVVINSVYQGAFTVSGDLVAYGRLANDQITVSSAITTPAFLYGSGLGDTIVAGGGNTVLDAGSGNATLVSGAGHNIMIGGGASSASVSKILSGSAGNNVMVGGQFLTGPSQYPYDTVDRALEALLSEWGSTDSYATRVSNMMTGGGLANGYELNSTTVSHYGVARDTMIGGGATSQNWYLAALTDVVIGKKNTETETTL